VDAVLVVMRTTVRLSLITDEECQVGLRRPADGPFDVVGTDLVRDDS
jgi:hypothetical protein